MTLRCEPDHIAAARFASSAEIEISINLGVEPDSRVGSVSLPYERGESDRAAAFLPRVHYEPSDLAAKEARKRTPLDRERRASCESDGDGRCVTVKGIGGSRFRQCSRRDSTRRIAYSPSTVHTSNWTTSRPRLTRWARRLASWGVA